jgi:hypothetical protein
MTHTTRLALILPVLTCATLLATADTDRAGQVRPAGTAAQAAAPATPASHAGYLAYARASADWAWDHREESLARWRAAFDPDSPFGYRPPGGQLEIALIYASLFEEDRNPVFADRARTILATYGDYRSAFPDWAIKKRPDYDHGVPALPDFFVVMRYLRAYDVIHRLGKFSPAEVATIEQMVGHSIDYLLQTSEWGTMNRTMLRAESLAWAVRALPKHPRAAVWEKQRQALGDDNWGNWQIEDATIYNGIWLYALMGYADARGQLDQLFRTPEVYYYAQYYLNLLSPAGVVPDLGDSWWTQNWQHFFVFFEAAAAHLKDPALAWAAQQIAGRFIDLSTPNNVGLGCFLLDAATWGGAGIQPVAPTHLSSEVMEDVQGKKVVFRNGWKPESTYLLLNYRDEGDGGMNFRDYLRDSIPVEEEKMTHGHADENSIPLLMSGGSVLLHDGGYRDYMPSGPFGAYRQDYFHNRLVVRPEKFFLGQSAGGVRYSTKDPVPGQPILDFLRNAGSYRPVRTRKVDFLSLPEFDYTRTRLIDDGWGYDYDRVVAYIKDPELFVVFDIFKSRTSEFFTLANLWHTRKIYAQGEHWYDTGYDAIGAAALPDAKRLLVHFPSTHFRLEGVDPLKRHQQDEFTIHQATALHFEQGQTEGFITVLVPHAKGDDPAALAARIRVLNTTPERSGLAVTIQVGDRRITVAAKQDLRQDIARDYRRPRYVYEKGRIGYGPIETDGDFLYASEAGAELTYTSVNMTRAQYGTQVLFQSGTSYHGLQFDGTSDPGGIDKVRYWRDTVKVTPNAR